MITLCTENKKDFTKKDKERLDEICQKLADFEIYNNSEENETETKREQILLDIISLLSGIYLTRFNNYVYNMVFKGKFYFLNVLTEKVTDRKI